MWAFFWLLLNNGMEENIPDQPTSKRKTRKTATIEVEGVVVGRNKKVVPPKDVERLAQMGCKDSEIAEWFGVDENTLRYNFSVELLKGKLQLNQSLRQAQIRLALSGNATMLIWLGKNILGQSESPYDSEANTPLPWSDED
jgi:hypothetical protein